MSRTWTAATLTIALGALGMGAALLAAPAPVHAADRALIIGVGDYENPDARLPGIDKDVAQAGDIANRMGFAHPTILADRQATRRGILTALKAALVDGASPTDRVFVYFSGHGAGVYDLQGDEADHQDEAILGADFRLESDGQGGTRLHGMVLDDEIAALLKLSPSRNILLIVDACHSGTIDRSIRLARPLLGQGKAVPKAYPIPKGAVADRAFAVTAGSGGNESSDNYVSLSAAGDQEVAIATENGSAFTVGLAEAVKVRSAAQSLSPIEMVGIAKDYIERSLGPAQRFTPEIHGNPKLQAAPIALSTTEAGDGPNWRRVAAVADGLPGLAIQNVKPRYVNGEPLEVAIDVPKAGYLNVIDVGPDDNMVLLFPNQFNPDNHVTVGKLVLPTPQMNFALTAQAPFGKSLILAILTTAPFDLRKSATDAAQAPPLASPALGALADLAASAGRSRSFAPTPRADAGAWAAKAETLVCRTRDICD